MARTARGREALAGIPSGRRTQKLQALLQGPLGPPRQHLDLPPGGPAHGPERNPPARARRLGRRARAPRIDVTRRRERPDVSRPTTAPASLPEWYARCMLVAPPTRAPAASPSAMAPRAPDPRAVAASDVPGGRRRVVVGSDTRQMAWPAPRGATQLARCQWRARSRSHRVQRDLPAQPVSAGPTATTYEIAHTGDWRMARARRYCGAWNGCGALGSRVPFIVSARQHSRAG